jgi:D-isomer specific 2-hydroxyacid dehydrogenase, NAD binding domain
VLSLHAPVADYIDTKVLANAKDLIIINAARSNVINGEALRDAVNAGKIKGITIDVDNFPKLEDKNPTHPYLLLDGSKAKVRLIPHIAGDCSRETDYQITYYGISQIIQAMRGEPQNIVSSHIPVAERNVDKPLGIGRLSLKEAASAIAKVAKIVARIDASDKREVAFAMLQKEFGSGRPIHKDVLAAIINPPEPALKPGGASSITRWRTLK